MGGGDGKGRSCGRRGREPGLGAGVLGGLQVPGAGTRTCVRARGGERAQVRGRWGGSGRGLRGSRGKSTGAVGGAGENPVGAGGGAEDCWLVRKRGRR